MQPPTPVTLANDYVTLRPLSRDEGPAYFTIGQAADIWRYLSVAPFTCVADADAWIDMMLVRQRAGDVTFSVYDNASGRLAGSSSFLEVRTAHGGLEIGFTWYGNDFRRTHVNTATKIALLEHAFESLDAHRVQLQTDERNTRSQQAIERIGAVKEGVLRQHKTYPSGYVRNSVMYSIVRSEWPDVRNNLETMLNR